GRFLARVDAAAENGELDQLLRTQFEARKNRCAQRRFSVIQRKLEFVESDHSREFLCARMLRVAGSIAIGSGLASMDEESDESRASYTTLPAAWPEAQAHWKLYPPRWPVTSMTSPMK